MAARRAHGLGQEPAALVVAQRLDVHPGPLGDLTDSHAPTVNPYLGTDVKRSLDDDVDELVRDDDHPALLAVQVRVHLRGRTGACDQLLLRQAGGYFDAV